MSNRPLPPVELVEPVALANTFNAYDWITSANQSDPVSLHGMDVKIATSTSDELINVQGSGALLFLMLAYDNRNNDPLNYGLTIQIDGNIILSKADYSCPGLTQEGIVPVGQIMLSHIDRTNIRGAETDYLPFQQELIVTTFKTDPGDDIGICYDLYLT